MTPEQDQRFASAIRRIRAALRPAAPAVDKVAADEIAVVAMEGMADGLEAEAAKEAAAQTPPADEARTRE